MKKLIVIPFDKYQRLIDQQHHQQAMETDDVKPEVEESEPQDPTPPQEDPPKQIYY